jgi:hypothetical protein
LRIFEIEPHTLWTGVHITRRKHYHLVTDPAGEIVFRHRLFWPCVEFLRDSEIKVFLVRPAELGIEGVDPLSINEKDQKQWQS